MAAFAACTIVSKNYLPFARVLARSLAAVHPEAPFFVLLVDRAEGRFDPEAEPFTLLEMEELGNIPDFRSFCFKYTLLEINTAVKPYFLEVLFARHLRGEGIDRLIYFDPDILVFQPLEELLALLARSNLVLTPHLTTPVDDGRHPDEQAILKAGAYNLGFLGLRDGAETGRFLAWWRERVYERCLVKIEDGLFVDQKWIDLAPGLFAGVSVLRETGYNVAYWNLHGRSVALPEGVEAPRVDGGPLYFFHFSGFDPHALEPVSKHQDRFTLEDLPAVRPLFEHYRDLLLAAGFDEARGWPYAFGAFDDGVPIPDLARRLYHGLGAAGRERFGDPFASGPGSFRAWLNAPARGGRGRRPPHLSHLLAHLVRSREDLARAYPAAAGRDLPALVEWLEVVGRREYRLDDAFLEPVAPLLGRRGATRGAKRALRRLYHTSAARGLKRWLRGRVGEERAAELRRSVARFFGGRPAPGAAERVPEAPAPAAGPPGLDITGYFRAETGMGEGARGIARAARAAGVPCALHDLELNVAARRGDESFTEEDFATAYAHGVHLLFVNADQALAVYEHLGPEGYRGRRAVAFWLWELAEFPPRWRSAFEIYDEIWTPSTFCLEAISRLSPVPVRRVPLPVEIPEAARRAAKDYGRGHFGLPPGAFLVLYVFDLLSFFERKNPLAALRAFRRAFRPGDGARLVLKLTNPERAPREMARLRAEIEEVEREGLAVHLIDRYLSRHEIYGLMACCDTYLSLHRSEGYGLTIAEAMALGKPVVATAYSGNVDFMTVNNSLPARYRLVELEEDCGPYPRGAVWADADVEHAAAQLRRLREEPELARALGESARRDVARQLSPAAVGELARRQLEILAGGGGGG